MARNEQLIRQHKILQILERNRFGATLDEIRDSVVEELGLTSIHPRSIRRDIEALQSAGFFILVEESQRGKIWKMSRADKGLQKGEHLSFRSDCLIGGPRSPCCRWLVHSSGRVLRVSGTSCKSNCHQACSSITSNIARRCT
jgi:hypothetical protein